MKTIDEENSIDLLCSNPHSKRSSGQFANHIKEFVKEQSGTF